MVTLKIFNDDKIRKYNNFPTIKDPYILENSILRILNEFYSSYNQPLEKEFNINNPRIANTYLSYYTTSNFNSWGQLPMGYIYNDMIRHIKNQNTSSNYILTLESIYLEIDDKDYIAKANRMYLIYDIIGSYIVENYMNSYNYMNNNSNGIMVAYIPKGNDVLVYILSVGFNPYNMAKWFSTSQYDNDSNALPYIRYISLNTILRTIDTKYDTILGELNLECTDGRLKENINGCISEINKYDISKLRKKSIYDSNIKYGNYDIDYNLLNMYDNAIPACSIIRNDNSTSYEVYGFNHEGNFKDDVRIMKRQNDMIDIYNKRNN